MDVATRTYRSIIFPGDLATVPQSVSLSRWEMLDASPDCIKVLSVDGTVLSMNRAGRTALGVPEDSNFGMAWLPLLAESVHQAGRAALLKAAHGQSARFPGQSLADGQIKYWDNLLTPITDSSGEVKSILCVSRDVTEKMVLEKELEDAIRRERLLSSEMQHRIKNLFSVVSGLITFAENEAAHDATPEAATRILREKVIALSRASDVAFTESEAGDAYVAGADLGVLVRKVLMPYGDRCDASGDKARICSGGITTVALFLHEFATNSVKYGALSKDAGRVTIRWAVAGDKLTLSWVETGGPALSDTPKRQGYGSEMVERLVRSAGGKLTKTWASCGLVAELKLPN